MCGNSNHIEGGYSQKVKKVFTKVVTTGDAILHFVVFNSTLKNIYKRHRYASRVEFELIDNTQLIDRCLRK